MADGDVNGSDTRLQRKGAMPSSVQGAPVHKLHTHRLLALMNDKDDGIEEKGKRESERSVNWWTGKEKQAKERMPMANRSC